MTKRVVRPLPPGVVFVGLKMPAPLHLAAKDAAQARGVTVSAIARQALTWYLLASNPSHPSEIGEEN